MTIYAIGDVQGCFDELQTLLKHIHFDPAQDQLWFCGDLVNRGNKSLETLRYVKSLGTCAISVLGNHDLHLLAAAHSVRRNNRSDTLTEVLNAPDCDELINWLRHLPLLHHDATLGFTLVHAGLPPQWDLALAQSCAYDVENVLRGADYTSFLEHMYGNKPDLWDNALCGHDRTRFILNGFTRIRYCTDDGRLDLENYGPPGSQPAGYRPWFELEERKSRDLSILFGHWSTSGNLGIPGIYPLDTGCLWGGKLTALKLGPDPVYISIKCPGQQVPG